MFSVLPERECFNWLGNSMKVAHYFLSNKILCDVTILVGGKRFHVHRLVLATSCPYFFRMFTSGLRESNAAEVELKVDLDPNIFERLIQMFYTGQLEINNENVWDLFAASDYFMLSDVTRRCELFLQNWMVVMPKDESLKIWELSSVYGCPGLQRSCERYFRRNFFDIIKSKHVLDITADCFFKLFFEICNTEDDCFENKVILETVHAWLNYVPEDRSSEYDELSRWKRFSEMLQSVDSSSHVKDLMMTMVRSAYPGYREDENLDITGITDTILRTSLEHCLGIPMDDVSSTLGKDGDVSRQPSNCCVPKERTPNFVLIQNETTEATAVAWLDGKICVLCSSRMVYIFPDHEPFSEGIVDIDLSRHSVFHPTDMVACAANQTLYISNADDCKIYEFQVPTSTTAAIIWPDVDGLELIHRPLRLSLTQSNELVILQQSTCADVYFLCSCELSDALIYEDASDDIVLPVDVSQPKHAIKLQNGNYVVGYTSVIERPGLECIAEFSWDGDTLHIVVLTECYSYISGLSTPVICCSVNQLSFNEDGIMVSFIYETETTFGMRLLAIQSEDGFQTLVADENRKNAENEPLFRFCYTPSREQLLYGGLGISSVFVAVLNKPAS